MEDPSLSAERKRELVDVVNRIRLAAEKHLGESGRDSLEKSYSLAIDAIHSGDDRGAIEGLVAELETAASRVGGSDLKAEVSSVIASVVSPNEFQA